MTLIFRPAHLTEAKALTALTRRSKVAWGYDAEFMRLAQDQLQITAQQIEAAMACYVLEENGHLLGFYHLKDKDRVCWLEDLLIEPAAMGKGYGKLLFEHTVTLAPSLGYHEMEWESDPNAEPFYLKMGAHTIGTKPTLIGGRVLPIMRLML